MFDAITITLNPAIDRTVAIRDFNAGSVNRVETTVDSPGGKGVNVAAALADDGLRVAVTGFLGEENSSSFDRLFSEKNIADRFSRLPGQTRVAIKIVDRVRSETTEINFPGLSPTDIDLAQFHLSLSGLDASWAILGGSLPPNVPPNLYCEIIAALKARKIRVALDTSGKPLAAAISSAPTVIKPNLSELVSLVGRPLHSRNDIIAAARQILSQGIEIVAVSMGSAGAVFVNSSETFFAQGPALRAASAVGAGDAMLAGLVSAQIRGLSLRQAARLATVFAIRALNHGTDEPGESMTAYALADLVTVLPA